MSGKGTKRKAGDAAAGGAGAKKAARTAAAGGRHPAYGHATHVFVIMHQHTMPDDSAAFEDLHGDGVADELITTVVGAYATQAEAQRAAEAFIQASCVDPTCEEGGHPSLREEDGGDSGDDVDEDEGRDCCPSGRMPRIPADLTADKYVRTQFCGSAPGDTVWIERVPFGGPQ